jgi:hypothetical protein
MNVFKDLDYLRHHDDLLNNLLEDERHFNQSLLMSDNLHWNVDYSIDNLKDLLDVGDFSDCFFEFLKNNSLLNNSLNISDSLIFISHLNNLLVLFHNFFDSFHYDWNFNYSLNNILDVFVDVDELGNDLFDLNYSWYLNYFLL